MTAQEQQMIQGLMDRVNQTQIAQKDQDAEQMLQQNLGRNPDAIYVLAQTVIVQGYALEQAQRQLAEARQQLDQLHQQQAQPQQHTSFLGSLLGHKDPPPPPPPARIIPQSPQTYTPQSYGQQQSPTYAPVPGYAPVSGYAPAAPSSFGGSAPAGGGFLQGAMQTAAGVAAGALAFQGIESLMHGFGHAAGYGAADLGGFGGGAPREEVVNNYYGDSGDRDSSNRDQGGRQDFDTAAENGSLSPDLEDRRLADSGSTDVQDGNDPNGFEDAGNSDNNDIGSFDNSSDDSSSFDDGGSFGSGGDDSNFS